MEEGLEAHPIRGVATASLAPLGTTYMQEAEAEAEQAQRQTGPGARRLRLMATYSKVERGALGVSPAGLRVRTTTTAHRVVVAGQVQGAEQVEMARPGPGARATLRVVALRAGQVRPAGCLGRQQEIVMFTSAPLMVAAGEVGPTQSGETAAMAEMELSALAAGVVVVVMI